MVLTSVALIVIGVVALALAALGTAHLPRRRARPVPASTSRILFPFVGRALSRRALDAALRLSRVDGATLVPVFLAQVPLHMPLDAPLPRQCTEGMPLLETIEQRAIALGVPVDARIERGRTHRHALREAIAHERYDRLVVAAAGGRSPGFHGDDVAWLLEHAPGELVIIRPGREDSLAEPRRRGRGSGGQEPRRGRLPRGDHVGSGREAELVGRGGA